MIAHPDHDEMADLLGAYALDAVDDHEARRIERHLAECLHCQAEVEQLRRVAAALGTASGLEGHEPPTGIWDRIAAGTGAAADEPEPRPPQAPSMPSREPAAITPLDAARRRRPGHRGVWSAALAATAAAAAIAALAVGLVNTQGRVHQLQSALAGRSPDAAVHAALATPGHQVVDLRTRSGAGVAQLVVEPSGAGYVVTSTMSKLPSAETYQMWANIGGRAISLGLLGTRLSTGSAFNLGSAANAARELMVTVEPAAGVVAPDRAPVATAPLRLA